MLEGSTLTTVRVVGIVAGTLVANLALKIALTRFFTRAERGDAERIASLRQVAATARRVVLAVIAGLLILDTLGISIGVLVAALGVIGLAISFGAQPLIRDIIGYVSFVFADNFRVGEEVAIVGMRGELLKFELRGVVLRVSDDEGERLAYVPYSKIATVENFDRAIEDA
jgi:small conductance mechanosensitive channel